MWCVVKYLSSDITLYDRYFIRYIFMGRECIMLLFRHIIHAISPSVAKYKMVYSILIMIIVTFYISNFYAMSRLRAPCGTFHSPFIPFVHTTQYAQEISYHSGHCTHPFRTHSLPAHDTLAPRSRAAFMHLTLNAPWASHAPCAYYLERTSRICHHSVTSHAPRNWHIARTYSSSLYLPP
jgi:hypothetical protein